MPTVDRWKNPYQVGEVVTMVNQNGTGEGILWQVIDVRKSKVKIRVCFCPTGKSVLRDKLVMYHDLSPVDVLSLCTKRAELDNIIRDVVRMKTGDCQTVGPQDCCGNCGRVVDDCEC